MSKEVFIDRSIEHCNDLNLHRLLAFASLPVTPALDISKRQGDSEAPFSPLVSQTCVPTSSKPKASSSVSHKRDDKPIGQESVRTSSKIAPERSSGQFSPASEPLSHPVCSIVKPQMIASKDVYKMTPAPVFMTQAPSVYPQVALIPETDLLRSMIVQDVKQVTQKLFDKNSKKKRGRRREKEEIIPGDFGTLKVNFTKFVDVKHPPFFLEAPTAPKRTVYQRIAPYPVLTADSSKAIEKPSKKTKGTRGCKRHDSGQVESAPCCTQGGINDAVACSSARQRRNSFGTRRSRQREVRKSFDVPATSISHVNGLGGDVHLANELPSCQSGQVSATTSLSYTPSTATVNCVDTMVAGENLKATPDFTRRSNLKNQNNFTVAKDATILDTDSNCNELSPGFLLGNNDTSYSELLESSAVDSLGPGLGSPGVIGNELNSLLSELYSNFPPLTPVNAEENMEVAMTNEVAKDITTTVSVLSQPLASHQSEESAAGRVNTYAEKNVPNSVNLREPSPSILDASSSIDHDCIVTTNVSTQNVTTEVLNDSHWHTEDEQCHTTKVPDYSSESKITQDVSHSSSDTLFIMDVDINQSERPHELLNIVDISPEYASTEGGGKIILIGSWNNKNARYSCKFGDVCASADLIQNGVLRCFCPPHSPGKVRVCVLSDDVIISKSVDFEYVDTEDLGEDIPEERHDWLKIKDEDLKSLLVERIEAIIDIFDVGNTLPRFQGMICNSIDIEDTMVNICESISKVQDHLPINIVYKSEKVMTVLHLSAALGFTKLIQTLCNWIETNTNKIIQQEADPCKYDQFQLTPLMWACAKGKFDSACVLIQWDEASIGLFDACGCTPLSISKDQGHTILVRYLEKSQSKGSISKNSSFASDAGSPSLRSGNLSRSSSLSSQIECGKELHAGNDDLMLAEPSRKSPGLSRVTNDGSPDSSNGYLLLSRTLGQTLVHVQAIIQDGADSHNDSQRTPLTNLDLDDDSLFAPSPFTPRMHSNSTEDRLGNHTPKSLASLSPASPAGSQSPFDPTSKDTAEFCEFFYNSDRILEKDFAELTLTDEEQRNLYKAASVIQNAYKGYRERRKQRDVELSAAVLIQSYYRRYKEYAMYKKMQRGALVIQHKYRAHREKKKQKSQAASVIQSYYRRYKERKNQPVAKDMMEIGSHTAKIHSINAASQLLSRPNNAFHE